MDRNDLEKMERAFKNGDYKWRDFEKLPYSIQQAYSELKAERDLEIALLKIDYEPRDWSKAIDYFDCFITGFYGQEMVFINHLSIWFNKEAVFINIVTEFLSSKDEAFRTKEKLDSFIEALSQARDAVFGE